MDGKRFGVGLAAGLLVALAIVTASGGLGTGSGYSFVPALVPHGGAQVATTTVTNAMTSTGSTSTGAGGTTYGSTTPPIVSSVNATNGSIGASTTSSTTSPQAALKALNAALIPVFSSNIDSIAQQAPVSNAGLLIPVIIALVLGAVIYRASVRGREDTSKE